jgi:hypothetical protein
MTDAKILRVCSENKAQVKDTVSLALSESPEIDRLMDETKKEVEEQLLERAHLAKQLISL